MTNYPELQIGDVIEITVPLVNIVDEELVRVGLKRNLSQWSPPVRARIDAHPDRRYPHLVAWFDDGYWTDPFDDLKPGEWRKL